MVNKNLAALGLVFALAACSMFPQKKAPEGAPFICDSSAYINPDEFEIADLATTSDLEFHRWAKAMATKYAPLKNSYTTLYQCVKAYHGDSVGN